MTQARHSEFDVTRDLPFVRRKSVRAAVATGDEVPVSSPALELQRALDEMFTSTPVRRTDYTRGVVLTVVSMTTIAACSMFWWAALRWAASLVA